MIGLGLLEAVYDSDIESLADPDDADGDGISGRPNRVWDDGRQALALGRFGWKAGQPSVLQQSVHAINGDIGISTPGMPSAAGDCTPREPARSEEHTSELQSLMRISYAVFCLKKKNKQQPRPHRH